MGPDTSLEVAVEVLFAAESGPVAEVPPTEQEESEAGPWHSLSVDAGLQLEKPALSFEAQSIFDRVMSADVVSSETASRLLLRIDAAVRQKLVAREQRAELHEELRSGNVEVVRDFLALIGVRNEPGMPLEDAAAPWECSICFSEQEELGWQCSEGHQYCHQCMRHHVNATVRPSCPQAGCCVKLEEADLIALQVSDHRLRAFRDNQLRTAVDSLGTSSNPSTDKDVVIRCSQGECSNAVVVNMCAPRCSFACPCGALAVCTRCRQAPYHFHGECSQVQGLRQSWLEWVSGGREEYFQCPLDDYVGHLEACKDRIKALEEGLQRHREVLRDEEWKANNCRLCPGCRRPIEKMDGCNAMVCGQNYHGGNMQPGCGRKFNWSEALRYTAVVGDCHPKKPNAPTSPRDNRRGLGVFHPFVNCHLCGSGGQGIKGLRFRCIHCEDVSVCTRCSLQLSKHHAADHVFEIMYESDYDWGGVRLPDGMPVRLVRHGDRMVTDDRSPKSADCNLEGMMGWLICFAPCIRGSVKHRLAIAQGRTAYGCYTVQLQGGGHVSVSAEHVEPMISSSAEAQQLIDGSFQVRS